ncbi:MAG: hypothetical protein OEZ34_07835 [Spirochaetia bacterium]|nr:hypothetical protein [Spirochaetia bacterium]
MFNRERLQYIELNGNLAVLSAVILIGEIILTLMILALFSLLGKDISDFLLECFVVYGILCTPFFALYSEKFRDKIS